MIREARIETFADHAARRGTAYVELCRPAPAPLSIPLIGGGIEVLEAMRPLIFLATLDDAFVFGRNGFVLSADDALLPYGISFRNYALAEDLGRHAVRLDGDRATLRLSDRIEVIEDEVLLMGGSENFAHFLHQFMGRLAVADAAIGLKGRKVLVYRQTPARFLDLLDLAGVARSDIVFADRDATIFCRRALVPSACIYRGLWAGITPCVWAEGLSWLRRLGDTLKRPGADRRLYLSRADCAWRKPANEEAIASVLEGHGYESVLAAGLGMKEQLALASQAGSILVPLGAGSWLSLFAAENASIIETAPPGIAGTIAGRIISAAFGFRYQRLIGRPVDFTLAERAAFRGQYWFDTERDRNYLVDTEELARVLDAAGR